ncbi:PREDICTED: mesoderm induction early response protein 1-like [Priapulus caudatus]|uniref:Mesoderm induction early response protein 1-like n=1 Tax=Priapulus caudatus TaxID=37621 RepID=A0ABM1EIN5_PRICU|nr:PREDICTED: mesoderm induction early response protein 1-like [Priapulus caudatus]
MIAMEEQHQQGSMSTSAPAGTTAGPSSSSAAGVGSNSSTNSRTSSPASTDKDFDPSADMLIHDFDDERTMEEEEMNESDTSCQDELNDLQKESDMPLEELLNIYGYKEEDEEGESSREGRSSSEEEILSNQDLTLDKDEVARDLLTDEDHDKETSVNELLNSVPVHNTSRLLRSTFGSSQTYQEPGSSSSESDDEDYQPTEGDWKKTIQVGSCFQAQIPDGLCKYGDAPAYENEDKLLWDPVALEEKQIETYLAHVQDPESPPQGGGGGALPACTHVRDDEQALYTLLQCAHNLEEALRRRRMQPVPPTELSLEKFVHGDSKRGQGEAQGRETMLEWEGQSKDTLSLWSEEECRHFENGLRIYGKDFHAIQQNKVRTRSVAELVTFYYLWKKTERHDMFANKVRLEKKKYALHPGITDYMDRFLDEQENPGMLQRDCSASPSLHTLVYGNLEKNAEGAAVERSGSVAAAPQPDVLLQDSAVGSSHSQVAPSEMVDSIRNISPQELTGIIHDLVKSQSGVVDSPAFAAGAPASTTPAGVHTASPTIVTCSGENYAARLPGGAPVVVDHRGEAYEPPAKRPRVGGGGGGEVLDKIQVSVSSVSSSEPASSMVSTSAVAAAAAGLFPGAGAAAAAAGSSPVEALVQ